MLPSVGVIFMAKIVLRKLKPVDLILLFSGFLFAFLLLASLLIPAVNTNYTETFKYITQPFGGVTFLLLGIFVLRNLQQPQKNIGFFLIAASAFSFIVSAVLIIKLFI
jgi:hypothetical protein